MSSLDQREKAEENRFAREQEVEFKIKVRGNKLFGLWLAAEFGLADDAAQSYALKMVDAGLEASDADLIAVATEDSKAHNADVSDNRLEKNLASSRDQARKEILGE